MHRDYWEKMASSYDEEIFDVLENDTRGYLRKAILKYASQDATVMDIGCAIGKWLPFLSPLFRKVYAVDISQKNLDIAKDLHRDLGNIEYRRTDMSGRTRLTPCNVGICINAILTPSLKDREIFFNSLARCIQKGGHIVLTVPSLESWMLSSIVQHQYGIDKETSRKEKNGKKAIQKWNHIIQGNADIDEVPHKHYLREELEILLNRAGFTGLIFKKVEYDWKTEFNNPPKWLKEPKPWDWMVVGERNKR